MLCRRLQYCRRLSSCRTLPLEERHRLLQDVHFCSKGLLELEFGSWLKITIPHQKQAE